MTHKENKIPMLIVQVEPPQNAGSGDYFYRTHAPGIAMAKDDGVYVINITNQHRKKTEIMMKADVLILKNICDADLLPLIRGRKEKRKLTVYEIADDLNALQTWNPVYFFWKNKENLALGYRLANCCDALQVTSHELKRLYGHLNKNCIVFPNQILDVPAEKSLKKDQGLVIGWGGSHGHLGDMAEIAEPLIKWIITKPNVTLHLMCSDPIWKLFDSLPQHKKKRTLPGTLDDYYNFLGEIDIGIAPLQRFAFNRSRSDVKFLEYAVSGVVPVVSHLEPYLESVKNGETGFFFKNTAELINILNQLTDNAKLTQHIAGEARQYVLRERLQIQHVHDRLDFYRHHLGQINGQNREIVLDHLFGEFSKLEGAIVNERHLQLQSTRFENLLHDGLIAMQVHRDKEMARKLFDEAAVLEPENYLTFMFAASITTDPIACLCKAVIQEPHSIKTWILLGEEFDVVGDTRQALECFKSAITVCPEYEVSYLRVASLLKRIGQESQSELFSKKAESIIQELTDLNNPELDPHPYANYQNQ